MSNILVLLVLLAVSVAGGFAIFGPGFNPGLAIGLAMGGVGLALLSWAWRAVTRRRRGGRFGP